MVESKYDTVHIAPIEIMKYFDIAKDAKFSLRTLLLLSVFAIAIFVFGIDPKSEFLNININDWKFMIFVIVVILGQGTIAWCSYRLYKSHIDNFVTHLKNEIIRIEEALNRSIRNDEQSKKESHHTFFMKAKLANHKSTLLYLELLYKGLEGSASFIVAGLSLIFIVVSWCTGKPVLQYLCDILS